MRASGIFEKSDAREERRLPWKAYAKQRMLQNRGHIKMMDAEKHRRERDRRDAVRQKRRME